MYRAVSEIWRAIFPNSVRIMLNIVRCKILSAISQLLREWLRLKRARGKWNKRHFLIIVETKCGPGSYSTDDIQSCPQIRCGSSRNLLGEGEVCRAVLRQIMCARLNHSHA